MLLLFSKVIILPVDRKIEFQRILYQLVVPFAHFFATPGCYCPFINGFTFIRNYQIFIYTDHFTVTLAALTGAIRIIEAEEIWRRFFKGHAVQFKAIAEKTFGLLIIVGVLKTHVTIALTLKKCSLHRVAQAADGFFSIVFCDAVNNYFYFSIGPHPGLIQMSGS